MKKNSFCWCAIALIGAIGTYNVSAQAAISSVSAGASANFPLGTNSLLLNQPAGLELRAQMPISLFGGPSHLLQISGLYGPYSVKNMSAGKLNMLGIYGGLTTAAEDTPHLINPFVSADIGAVYEYLNLSGVSNSVQNSAMGISLRFIPGMDLPLFGNIGLRVETPITAVWFKTALYTWSTLFSIRWKL